MKRTLVVVLAAVAAALAAAGTSAALPGPLDVSGALGGARELRDQGAGDLERDARRPRARTQPRQAEREGLPKATAPSKTPPSRALLGEELVPEGARAWPPACWRIRWRTEHKIPASKHLPHDLQNR